MFEKITEAEINERSMANVSTTPNRPTAFGESRLDAQALKLRFDRLSRYLAGRLNEIFTGISDGNLAKSVKIVEEKDGKTIEYSLAEFILRMIKGDLTQINVKVPEGTQRLDVICNQVLRWQNEIQTGDFADETVVVEGVSIRQFYEEFKKLEETGQGKPGEPGKSAYDYAVEGGYQGTEEEFAKKLATEYPSKVSQLENDEKYITASGAPVQTVNDKTGDVELSASDVGARPNTWMPSYSDVNADKAGTAQSLVGGHNTSTESHNDLRLELQRLAGIISDVLDSDDVTLDEMHEIVAVIKANTTIIEAITTGKVNVSDIIDNLTTNVKDKPLSAAQGVALKALIDALGTGKLDASELSNAINTALAQAKASGKFDGADGKTPYIQNGYWYINGVNQNVKAQGDKGTSVTVSNVSESTASGGTNVVTFSDGKTLGVKNGKDYVLTEADRNQIAAIVLEMLGGEPIFGYIDENKNIVLKGNLAEDTYSVKYEMEDEDGNISYIEIGDLVLDNTATYTVTTPTLTNCRFDGSATAIKGQGYEATITAYDGYELSTLNATMEGGGTITANKATGKISTDKVTGDIVITAVAEEKQAAEPITENITVTKEMSIVVGTGADRPNTQSYCATPHIDVSDIPKPCVISLKQTRWAYLNASDTGYIRFYIADKNGTKLASDYTHSSKVPSGVTMECNGADNKGYDDITVTVTSDNVGTLRFAGWYVYDGTGSASDPIVTLTYTPK